jgi:heme exporter protein B
MSNATGSAPTLSSGFIAVIRRDVLLAWKRPGDVLNPLIFFAIVSSLFPLAVGPGAAELALIGPGVVWVAALLAALLSLNSLYLGDYEDGSLEQCLLSPQPLPLLALAKSVAHWLQSGLPLVILSPLVALSFRMSGSTAQVMMLALALGTFSLSLLGSIGAALTVGLNRGNALLSLLIFGTRAVSLAAAGDPAGTGVYLLGAYCMLALALGPFAAAAALKISNE